MIEVGAKLKMVGQEPSNHFKKLLILLKLHQLNI